jgi:hypothetical protein
MSSSIGVFVPAIESKSLARAYEYTTRYDRHLVIGLTWARPLSEPCSHTRRDTEWIPGAERNPSLAGQSHDDGCTPRSQAIEPIISDGWPRARRCSQPRVPHSCRACAAGERLRSGLAAQNGSIGLSCLRWRVLHVRLDHPQRLVHTTRYFGKQVRGVRVIQCGSVVDGFANASAKSRERVPIP